MANISLENIEQSVKDQLKKLAAERGLSLEETVLELLRSSRQKKIHQEGLGTRLAKRFAAAKVDNNGDH